MPFYEDGSYQCLPGPALIAKILAGRCQMHYTRATVGQGIIPEDISPKALTEPPGYVMDAKIAAITNPVDGECQVTVQIYSADVDTGFYATGIMLYAEDPDLGEVPYTYLKLEEGMEWIRPASSAVGKLATFDLIAAVGAVDAVSAGIAPDAVATYAAVKRLVEEHDTSSEAHSHLLVRMKAMEVAVNGSVTILQVGGPTGKTEGAVGQHCIDPISGEEFVCVEAAEEGYVWEPADKNGAEPLRETMGKALAAHSGDENAHKPIQEKIDGLIAENMRQESRISLLELMYNTDVSGNPYTATFESLTGLVCTGVWNTALARLEF